MVYFQLETHTFVAKLELNYAYSTNILLPNVIIVKVNVELKL